MTENRNIEIQNWKKEIRSKDWETISNAADNLTKIGGDDILNFFINLLDTEDVQIRNIAALSLRELKDNQAVDSLLKSIFKVENKDYNGTMVYALQTLDCKDKLVELFQILFYESYESKIGAYTILNEQTFDFEQKDLIEIHRMWYECNKKPEKINGFDDEETKLMMEEAYKGFMEYLK